MRRGFEALFFAMLLIGVAAFGFVVTKPACSIHSVAMFIFYDGGWYYASTVERIDR